MALRPQELKRQQATVGRCAQVSVVVALLPSASCADDPGPERPPIAWEGEWLQYGADADVESVCAGTLDYMDGYVGTLVDLFEIAEPDIVSFYHVAGQDRLDELCTKTNRACTNTDAEVFSILAPQEHELVHAVRASANMSNPFFEEGAAERWGDDSLAFAHREWADRRDACGRRDQPPHPALRLGGTLRCVSR